MLHHFLNLPPLDGSLVVTDTVSMKTLINSYHSMLYSASVGGVSGSVIAGPEDAHLDGMLDAASCHLRRLGYFTLLPTVYRAPIALHTHPY